MSNPLTSPAMYERFQPPERLVLLLEAMARGDQAEIERVQRTCPRKVYSGPDVAFKDRYEMALDVTVVACGELRALLAQLRMLAWAASAARQACTAQQITSSLAFLDGDRHGKGQPQTPFFRLGLKKRVRDGQARAEEASDGAAGDDTEEEEPKKRLGEEFYRRMHAVERRGERPTRRLEWMFHTAEVDLASELKSIWTAYEGFCNRCVGIGAHRLLEACGWQGRDELAETLEKHKDATIDPETARQYEAALCGYWDRQFGTGK